MRNSFYEGDTLSKEDVDNIKFIIDSLHYSKKLETMVIKLRKEVNELTPEGAPIPYPSIHRDVYESFFDYSIIVKYQDYIEMYFDMEDI